MRKILEVLSQREKAVLHQEVNFRGVQLAPASDLGLQILFFLWGQGRMLALQPWNVAPHPHSILVVSATDILEGHSLCLKEAGSCLLVILSQQQIVHEYPEEGPLTLLARQRILQDPVELEHVPAGTAITRAA